MAPAYQKPNCNVLLHSSLQPSICVQQVVFIDIPGLWPVGWTSQESARTTFGTKIELCFNSIECCTVYSVVLVEIIVLQLAAEIKFESKFEPLLVIWLSLLKGLSRIQTKVLSWALLRHSFGRLASKH